MERERSTHPSRAQTNALLEYMEKNPGLVKGFPKIPSARVAAKKQWERLAIRLNCIGGSSKSWKQWTKYWADKRSAVKKKAALRYAARKNGGLIDNIVELNDMEERILSLIGGESFAIKSLEMNLKMETSEPPQPTDKQEPCPLDKTKEEEIEVTFDFKMEDAAPESVFLELDPLNEEDSVKKESFPLVPPKPPKVTSISVPVQRQVESPLVRPRRLSPVNSASPQFRNTVPPRRHFKRLIPAPAPASLPTQRSMQSDSIADRFLRMEEQRLELDRRNTRVLETMTEILLQRDTERDRRDADRESAVAQALTAVGEGLRLIGEAFHRNSS